MKVNSIRHMVIFSLKYDKGAPETEKFLKDSQSILSVIAGVEKFEMLKEISPRNEYDFGFSMEFSDKTTYDNYSMNPNHLKFVHERWLEEVVSFLEIDFENL